MGAITFDTLDASPTLRNPGVDARTAEAIAEIVRQTADLLSLDHLATKNDLREEISALRFEMTALEVRLSDKIRAQGLALVGAMAAIVGIATAVIKLV